MSGLIITAAVFYLIGAAATFGVGLFTARDALSDKLIFPYAWAHDGPKRLRRGQRMMRAALFWPSIVIESIRDTLTADPDKETR